MSELRTLVRAIAIAAAVSVGVVACVVVLTLLASGRPLSQFGPLVADVGAVTAALLLVCLAVLYLPLGAHMQRAATASRSSIVVTGAVLGLATFVARTFILRDGGDPTSVSAYVWFLRQNPWELAGLLPFVLGGVAFVLAVTRGQGRHSHESPRS